MSVYTSFIGLSGVTAAQIDGYVQKENPQAPRLGAYYERFGKLFGLRHDLAAGMMVHETNFLKFTGQVPIAHKNPAGLKVSGGAWARFATWEQGVHAHFERLAQYVYPACPNRECGLYDPAHSPDHWQHRWSIENRGSADRLIDVADLWTAGPAETYAAAVWQYARAIAAEPYTPAPVPARPWLLTLLAAAGAAGIIYLVVVRR